ncbi:hypothetical protein P168DRAFT_290964 [Aspergillus campestris IBT 28561]|uniref:CASTOR ACT domain-containing protein n=1 Tax=Aspergillus campestris (strain IBT 28561) TaxID=1392248 RepID=A0A2I1D1V5_ASPC2|nr:uncharacterized protein P168DRAFT_290964 [Aspergillus campestris IBT 28561]PKY03847.1 hypothetical protein P168DRAFT_290964 [Aspergillus campestris IBT 28561]
MDSLSLTSAQVQFMDDRLALVHIPLDLYPYFLQPILQVLFHDVSPVQDESSHPLKAPQSAFLNLSITPVECSVMCPRQLADLYFAPLIHRFAGTASSDRLAISQDDFVAMQVYGEGLKAGQRVLELTSPLAMAGISIFFISTYFSDYIIVPLRSKQRVIDALGNRGFQFEMDTEAFVNINQATPPPSSLNELQTRTFASLRKNAIVPFVDRSLRLVQCAAHHHYSSDASSISILREALTAALVVDQPRFLSLTLTAADPAASLLLEKRLLPRFASSDPDDDSSLLLGAKEDILVPVMLDLRKLPPEATGIVCGVASRLADATHAADYPSAVPIESPVDEPHFSFSGGGHSIHRLQPDLDASLDAVEISFLSTARAGTILVGEHELNRAMDALDTENHTSSDELQPSSLSYDI